MKHTYRNKNAFSLLEVIFVIVILGIVASIGAEIIANVYESHIVNRAQYRASIKSEQTLNQIANRLRYAIPGTAGARVTTGSAFIPLTEISNSAGSNIRHVLQWVGYDGDSFEAMTSTSRRPGWSGFIDLNASNPTTLLTPGSNLVLARDIIGNLGGSLNNNARLYFPPGSGPAATNGSVLVTGGSGENINVSGLTSGDFIAERYKLAWSSYAIVFEGTNLWLYYNFSPTVGATLGANKSLLLANVTSFSFKGSEGSVRIKVCQYENMDTNTTADAARSCKEKIILY